MKLIAIEPVKCGGKRHEPGRPFEADDKVGQALVDMGHAKKDDGKASKADDDTKGTKA